MKGPVPRRRPAEPVHRPQGDRLERRPGSARTPRIVELQRDAGNRAVADMLSLQRTSNEQIAQYKQYTTDGDWGRAAWQLATFDAKDIPAHVKGLTPRHLELLTEGARHHGATAVVDAVVAVNMRAAIIGTVRFHVWKHNWAESAKYLTGMERSDGRRLEDEMIASGLLDHAGLAEIIKHNRNLKLQAGEAITIGGEQFVVYDKVVRTGGTLAWRTNNPGALKSVEPLFGSIGRDESNFLIFPDVATGLRAARANVKYQLFDNPELPKNRTLLQVMEKYAPPGEGPNDPVLYANKIAAAVGVKPDDPVAGFSKPQVDKMVETIVTQEKTTEGTELAHDSPKLLREMRDLL